MFFKHRTLERINELSSNPAFGNYFDKMGNVLHNAPHELFEEIAEIFQHELELTGDEVPKLKFLLELGYLAGEGNGQNTPSNL